MSPALKMVSVVMASVLMADVKKMPLEVLLEHSVIDTMIVKTLLERVVLGLYVKKGREQVKVLDLSRDFLSRVNSTKLFYRLKEFALPGIILRIPCMLLKCFMENKQTSHEMLALAKFIIVYDYFLDPSGVLETSHLMIILKGSP